MIKQLTLELILRNYSDNPSKGNADKVITKIASLSLITLNDYCNQNETIKVGLIQPAFEIFWKKKRSAIKVKNLPSFSFKKTNHLSEFELTLGYLNYYLSLKHPHTKKHYIAQALHYHSYHALNAYTHALNFEQFKYNHPYIEKIAKRHGTPGYLLLANLYLKNAIDLKHDDKNVSIAAFELALKNLYLAKILAPSSTNDIHNAYFSQGLSKSNPFNVTSIDNMIDSVITLASPYIKKDDITIAQNLATIENTVIQPSTGPSTPRPMNTQFDESPEVMKIMWTQRELEKKNQWQETPLLMAVRQGKVNAVRVLLSLGANRFATDLHGNTALHLAFLLDKKAITKLLLDNTPELLTKTNQLGITCLELASQISWATSSKLENSILMTKAIYECNTDSIERLFNQGTPLEVILTSGKLPLYHAIKAQDTALIKLLLTLGISLKKKDNLGKNVLFQLLFELSTCNNSENKDYLSTYFGYLISLGANINAKDNLGQTMLIKAVRQEDETAIEFLLEQIDIDFKQRDLAGFNALDYAHKSGNKRLVRLLELSIHTFEIKKNTTLTTPKHTFFTSYTARGSEIEPITEQSETLKLPARLSDF
jgi:ankyrin repeat protein